MALFIPNVLTVEPIQHLASNSHYVNKINRGDIPLGTDFQKVYFEELTRKSYVADGNLESLTDIARIHQEEYYGMSGSRIKRFTINFYEYGVIISMEENYGRLHIKAS